MSRSKAVAVAIALLGALALPARAEEYPSKVVRIIVPFAAGGPADLFARRIGQALSDALGQQFIVDDRPGAGSIIGTDQAAKSPPDGYTLLMMSNTHTTNESLVKRKPYELMRDFVPVAPINYSDLVMVVPSRLEVSTLKDFIALARSKPKGLNYASSGTGTPYHMAGELFKAMSGTDIVHVPYKGSSGARNDVLGGQVEMMFDAITTMAPHVRAGAVKALATTGLKRSTVLPEVPTVDEAAVPGYEATIWLGIMAPAATPKPVVVKLNAEINKALAQPALKAQWAQEGAEPMIMTSEEFDAYLRKDIEKWAKVVEISGATMD